MNKLKVASGKHQSLIQCLLLQLDIYYVVFHDMITGTYRQGARSTSQNNTNSNGNGNTNTVDAYGNGGTQSNI